ncbi:2-hydroxyacid dehydrogenase [Quadrisphaera sp. DSM 44207]|uniref:2-hydroxyacid dehydrogenase n=1 Tax=Quadrisphaera sp. DSM 44207 TaxID=1881057 RepID=UPI0008871CCF|nr:2-hydroxyacid dehydrogenase [Quadrisphaera sp. DSM 44207]SDQ74567.1 Phosphoglycerate dehydrogenase [Quadrisphaera sp. DSM 44207]
MTVLVTLPDQDWLEAVHPLPPGVSARVWDVDSPPREALGEDAGRVRAVVLPYSRPAGALGSLADLPALSLVQSLSAGVDDLAERLPGGVALANAAGVHDASTAELAVGLALASLRGIDDAVRDAEQASWRPGWHRSLADRRVLVLGAGRIGTAVADRLAPFEVDLVRVASRARTDERGVVHGVEELPQLLPGAEVVVVVLPLTPSTRGLVDAAFLAAMPDGALLVNVGRGPLVDTAALLAELRRHRLRAALDVVDPEPLPGDHPLWGAPGLVLTPHLGGTTSAMRPRAVALLRRQLQRLGAGEEPVNLVG